MSDRYDITCECGYTNRVAAQALGLTRECPNCSADLFIDPEKAVAVPDKSDANHERRLREAAAAGKSTKFVRHPDATSFAALAEPDTTHPPKPPTQQPMKHNPFADEDAEEEGSPFAVPSAPPSRVEDVEPAPSRSRYVEIPTISSLDKATGETCASCGRTLRGQWDRVETPEGIICYICSNQATESIPERIKDRPEPRLSNEPPVLYDVPERERTDTNKSLFGIDTESEGFKRFVFAIAVATVLFAIGVWLTGDTTPRPERTPQELQALVENQEPLPLWAMAAMRAWQIASSILATFIALYIVCEMGPGLPHETFKLNVLQLGYVMLIMAVPSFVLSGIIWMLGGAPILQYFFGFTGGIILFFYTLWVVMHFLDFGVRHIILWFFVSIIVAAMVNAVGLFVYGFLGMLIQ